MTESSIEKWTQFFHMNNNKMVDRYQKGSAKVKVFSFDFSELIAFNPTIAQEYLENPDVVMKHANDAVKEYPFASMKRDVQPELRVRFEKFPSSTKKPIRDLRKDLLDSVVTVEGTVRNVSTVEPRLIIGAYECGRCHYFNYIDQNSIGRVTEPAFCGGAECADETKKGIFTLRIKESTFDDYQRIKVQEGQEDLKGGEKPESIDINLSADLTARATPGQHITVNGILRGSQKQTKEGKMVFFDLYMDAISIEFEENDFADIKIMPEDEAEIMAAAKDPHIFENLIASIAPSIKGHEEVKLAITLQLFGGVRTTLADGSPVRGDSHILLVGDPGVAKSLLVKYVINLAPRGQYASGKSASAAGLTATITKDEFDGQFTFEAGTLVLADNGIAAVDELDKMKADDRSSLHEALEQQSISLAKATVHTVLKARCSLLAAANPKLGRFDKYTPIAQQIDLPPSLLSRFDLMFVLMDEPNPEKDDAIAAHILKSRLSGELAVELGDSDPRYAEAKAKITPYFDPKFVRKYVAYAKRHINPVMSEEAIKKLQTYYTTLRSGCKDKDNAVPITARQLEGLVRLAEASARVRLSKVVTAEDAARSIQLLSTSLAQTGYDPETGEIDIDRMYLGMPKSQSDRIREIMDLVRTMVKNGYPEGVPHDKLIEKAREHKMDISKVEKELLKLKSKNELYEPKNGLIKPTA